MWDVFNPGMKDLYAKYCLGYVGIPSWTTGIPRGGERMKNVPASYKRSNEFMKKLL